MRISYAAIVLILLSALASAANPPAITSLSPNAVAAGSPAFTLNVYGTNLSYARAYWNGGALTTLSHGRTHVSASVPSNLVASAGTATVTVVSYRGTSNAASFTITASNPNPTPAPTPVALTTTALPAATAASAYSATLQASGGVTPYAWTATGLPAGLALNGSTGAISGTPSAAGTFSVNVTVKDSAATPTTSTRALALTVASAAPPVPALAITTTALAGATAGTAYSAALNASGGVAPYSWTITSGQLPTGVALNASTGLISGTPSTAGNYSFSVSVKDSESSPASVSKALSISVAAAATTGTLILNRDLSTGDLSQWTNKDWGLGTNTGSNNSGAGYLWYHSNVAGRRAAGMTVTPTAHASPAASSDSVYLWEPTQSWNYNGQEVWVRTSFLFPSSATISTNGATGEQPFQPTTGEWNWFMTFHNDSNPLPSCSQEYGNLAFDVKTDDPIISGNVGTQNVRLAVRIMGGDDCAPNIVYVNGPALQRDHWYEYLLHIKWSPTGGIFEWFVDGQQYYSNFNIPTLYTRPAGYVSPSYTSLTMANYRWHATWNSTIYLGPLAVGTTRSVVTNAF